MDHDLSNTLKALIDKIEPLDASLAPYFSLSESLTGKRYEETGVSDKIKMAQLILQIQGTGNGHKN